MGKKEEWRPRPFFGGFHQLDDLLDELRWELETDRVLEKQQESRKAANPPNPETYKKEDKKYKTG